MAENVPQKIEAIQTWDNREGFSIKKRLDGSEGHGVRIIDVMVFKEHPEKEVTDTKRIYNMISGNVEFIVNGVAHTLTDGMSLVLNKGDVYSYKKTTGLSATMYEVCVV